MLYGIHGYLGSGKTLLSTLIVEDYFFKGFSVYSNITLNFPSVTFAEVKEYYKSILKPVPQKLLDWGQAPIIKPLNVDELMNKALFAKPLDEPLVVLQGDEWQMFMDSRRSQDTTNVVNSYFLFQTRKRHTHFVYTAPKRGLNDVRLRDSTNIAFLAEKKHRLRNEVGQFKEGKVCYDNECEKEHMFKYVEIDLYLMKAKTVRLWEPEKLYGLYDTEQMVSPFSAYTEQEIEQAVGKAK
jgi:hypothetical protein